MITPCPNSILNEKELQNFAKPYEIAYPINIFEDEYGNLIVIFNLKNQDDNKIFIFSKNEKIYQAEKIYFQYSIYKILTHLNFQNVLKIIIFPRST
jgi:hypothetical protein